MSQHLVLWSITFGLIVISILALGLVINKQIFGILIDSRGKMSLSRLQLVLWTCLLASSIFTIAFAQQTMNIVIGEELWALVGISLGSATGAVMVKGVKQVKEPSEQFLSSVPQGSKHVGLLHVAANAREARFTDMFKGEELSDFAYIDISKVQMFFFTIAAWLGYVATLWAHEFKVDENGVIQFPLLSAGIVTLIGVSHAGYITMKASDKTPKNIQS